MKRVKIIFLLNGEKRRKKELSMYARPMVMSDAQRMLSSAIAAIAGVWRELTDETHDILLTSIML